MMLKYKVTVRSTIYSYMDKIMSPYNQIRGFRFVPTVHTHTYVHAYIQTHMCYWLAEGILDYILFFPFCLFYKQPNYNSNFLFFNLRIEKVKKFLSFQKSCFISNITAFCSWNVIYKVHEQFQFHLVIIGLKFFILF